MSGNIQIDAVVEARTDLGESPVWDERSQRLYFIDINSKKIHIWDNKSKSHASIDMPELVGTIILAPDEDQLVVALTRSALSRTFWLLPASKIFLAACVVVSSLRICPPSHPACTILHRSALLSWGFVTFTIVPSCPSASAFHPPCACHRHLAEHLLIS